ncbi:sigma-54-dependent Fis family transcriptional regulator (plasmid) [Fulvitalea axinellae]|uniref:Sigma-54-dependent Fis family transcriptional regulator n=1 Tax=Fulvitalea axinellae TaxID=1182444 RepID=A0AAU9DG96_9BACT|nr:sigma-54-dependent Fis family transcriptional regulator [Fulvitalea axinellae]
MKDNNILIVDDNKGALGALELLLQERFGKVTCLSTPHRIPRALQSLEPDLVLLDMNFSAGQVSGNEGLYWLRQIRQFDPQVPVVMITAYGDVELAVKALKEGAADFVLKPWNNEKLLATVESSLKLGHSRKEIESLRKKEKTLKREISGNGPSLIGRSKAMAKVLELVDKVANTDANVLITGENGTGKEVIAKEIHRKSARSDEAMITVDMGSIPETLFEGELFGHSKGAFTDAKSDRMGKFEAADKGSLFLDEIGNLPERNQAKLLTALQRREVVRVGEVRPRSVDIRLICATNTDLEKAVVDKSFREDLLYRINTIHIHLPTLRDRQEDIPDLTNFFVKQFGEKYGKKNISVSPEGMNALKEYSWPGNVRELQHTIEKALILAESNVLESKDFLLKEISPSILDDFPETIEDMERKMISISLDKHNGNLSAAAKQLGITRQTLYNKLKKFGW